MSEDPAQDGARSFNPMRTSSPNQPDVLNDTIKRAGDRLVATIYSNAKKAGLSPFSLMGMNNKVSGLQNRIRYDGPHVNTPVSITRYATKIASN